MLRAVTEESAEEDRKIAVVHAALGTLSYSELEAISLIFQELHGTEGILVASKIADQAGITRSVIVNALRKFESAGNHRIPFLRHERHLYQGLQRICLWGNPQNEGKEVK